MCKTNVYLISSASDNITTVNNEDHQQNPNPGEYLVSHLIFMEGDNTPVAHVLGDNIAFQEGVKGYKCWKSPMTPDDVWFKTISILFIWDM